MIPAGWGQLGFTSGRRTHLGNRRVGGVPNSDHLDGTAADFTAPVEALRAHFGPNVRILDEKDHRHVGGLSDVPYYGNRGVAGLVNGVDTSAPRSAPMPPKKTLKDVAAPQFAETGFASSDVGAPLNLSGLVKPQTNFKKGGVLGTGLSLGDILANGLVGFASGMGNPAPAQSLNDARARMQQQSFDRERWAQELELKRQKALEPPQWLEDARVFSQLPDADKKAVLSQRDAMYPVLADVTRPDGSVYRQQIPRSLPGGNEPPQEAIAELRSALSQGDQGAIAEFEQVFGAGSARRYLGQ